MDPSIHCIIQIIQPKPQQLIKFFIFCLFVDSSQASHSSGCFTATSTVVTESGEKRKLSELQIGERVLSMNGDGQPVFSEVLMFMDRDVNQKREFVEIRTERGSKITVTPAHLLLTTSLITSKNVERVQKYTFADRVQEGDYLLVNINGTLMPDRVRTITATLSRGVFAPLTGEGTIVVDGVVASCYALIDSQLVAHLSFMPVRLYNVLKHWFSWSESTSDSSSPSSGDNNQGAAVVVAVNSVNSVAEGGNSIDRNTISKEDVLRKPIHFKTSGRIVEPVPMASVQSGVHWYARALYSIKDMVLPASWIYHWATRRWKDLRVNEDEDVNW